MSRQQAIAEANLTGFGLDDRALRKAMRLVPDGASKALWRGFRRGLASFRRQFLAEARGRVRIGDPGASQQRTGKITNLARTFVWGVKPTTDSRVVSSTGILGEFFTRSRAALAMEFGVTIRPRRKQALAIPIAFAIPGWRPGQKRSRGKPKRGWQTPARARRQFAGRWTIFRGSGDKSDVLFARSTGETAGGRRRKPKVYPVFKLVREIKLKPRLGFFRAWDAYAPEVGRRINDEIGKVLQELPR